MRSPAWDGDWLLTQSFGVNAAAYARYGLAGHNGIDVGCPSGTPLLAPEAGYVLEVSSDPMGYGLTVYLLGTSEWGYRYGHASALLVHQGQEVPRGHVLALSGTSGNSTGPHLHLGTRPPNPDWGNGYGGYADPTPRLAALAAEMEEDDDMACREELAAVTADRDRANRIKAEFEAVLRDGAYQRRMKRAAARSGLPLPDYLIQKADAA